MASFNELMVNTIEALSGSLESNINRDLRQKYQEFLSNLQNNIQCPLIFCEILTQQFQLAASTSSNTNEGLCLITLTLLNDFIKKKWNILNNEQQNNLRTLISNLVSHFDNLTYSVNLSNKFASILSEIIERQYPQLWPSFLQDFLPLAQEKSYKKQEIFLKVFQFLYMDCLDNDFSSNLPIVRRTEIISALQNNQKILVETFFNYFSIKLNKIKELKLILINNMNDKNILDEYNSNMLLLSIFLQLLFYLIKIINVEYFFTYEMNYFPLILECLNFEELQIDTAHVLERLLSQEFTQCQSLNPSTVLANSSSRQHNSQITYDNNNNASYYPLILDVILLNLFKNNQQKSVPKDPEKLYLFVNLYLNMLVSFFLHNANELLAKELTIYTKDMNAIKEREGCLMNLMKDILELIQFPSRLIIKDNITNFIKLFKLNIFYTFQFKNDFIVLILNELFKKFFFNDKNSVKEDEDWYDIEFNSDEEDYKSFYSMILSQYRLLLNEIHIKLPSLIFSHLIEKINYFLNELEELSSSPNSNSKKSKKKWLECNRSLTLFMSLFESLGNTSYNLVDTGIISTNTPTAAAASSAPAVTPELLEEHKQSLTQSLILIEHLMNWNPTKYKVKKIKLLTLSCCSCLFFLVPEKLIETLSSLFQWIKELHTEAVQVQLGSSQAAPDDLSAKDLCEYSGQILAILIQKCGDKLFKLNNSYILLLLNEVNSILTVSSTSDESTFYASMSLAMREALIILSFYTNDKNTKEEIYKISLFPMLNEFNELVTKNFYNVEVFIKIMQEDLNKTLSIITTPPSPLLSNQSQCVSLLQKLVHGILAISNITSKIHTHLSGDHPIWRKITQLTSSINPMNPPSPLPFPFNPNEADHLYQEISSEDPTVTYLGQFCNNLLMATHTLTQLWDLPAYQYLTSNTIILPNEYYSNLPQSLAVSPSPTIHIPLSSFVYGLSKSEFFKYSDNSDELLRLLQQKYSQSLLKGIQEELCSSISLLFKSLGHLTTQKNLFLTIFLNCNFYNIFNTIINSLKYIENNILVYVLKNFYELYFVHYFYLFFSVPSITFSNTFYSLFLNQSMDTFFNLIQSRLEIIFNKQKNNEALYNSISNKEIFIMNYEGKSGIKEEELNVVESLPLTPYNGNYHILSIYLHSNLYSNHLVYSDLLKSSGYDLLFTIRTNIVKGLLNILGQFLSAIFGLRGLLSIKATTASFVTTDKKMKKEELEHVRNITLSYFLLNNEKITHDLLKLFYLIINQSRDATQTKTIFNIIEVINHYLSSPIPASNPSSQYASAISFFTTSNNYSTVPSNPSSINEPASLTQFFTKDLFNSVLDIILKSEPWIEGNEWDFIDYLNDTITKYCLTEPPVQTNVKKNANKPSTSFDSMTKWNNTPSPTSSDGSTKIIIPHIKIENLLRSNLFNPHEVNTLKNKLLEAKSKKRRDILKDFFNPIINKKNKSDKVQDVKTFKYNKPKQRQQFVPSYDTEVGGLFPGIDDDL